MKNSLKWSGHYSGLTTLYGGLTTLWLFASFLAKSQTTITIIPRPADIKMEKGFSIIKEPVGFIVYDFEDPDEHDGVNAFKNYLKKNYRLTKFVSGDSHSYGLPFEIHYSVPDEKKEPGYYELEVKDNRVYIKGTALGKFYAFQTLKQMISINAKKEISIPNCKIKDWPRFQYRGMHLDVARHFFPVEQIKKYLDWMAAYKFNKFHWHLTEDQGWRIEIKKYPKLTSVGAYRNGTIIGPYPGTGNDSLHYGGFYTQKQIKDIVKYAADRYIEVIPEIEMPGHSSAAIAAYPELSCFPGESSVIPANTAWTGDRKGKQVQQSWGVFEDVLCPTEYSFKFLEDVLDEMMQLFPSGYIHIGGDEAPKESWKRSVFCQQLIKEKGLKDELALQSYFIGRIEKYINSKRKKIIGWDEILEGGLAENATVMSWRGEAGGIAAARLGHDVIMTPENPLYLNHAQSNSEDSITQGGYNPLEAVYNYDPVSKELNEKEAKHILGAQGNMWSEYISNERKLEYMLFPRMLALSESLWSPKEKKDWSAFEKELPFIFKKLDAEKINYSKAYYDIKSSVSASENYDAVKWQLETRNKDCNIVYVSGRTDNAWMNYKDPVSITSSGIYSAALVNKAGKVVSNWHTQKFIFNKATGKKITLINQPSKNYPGNGAITLVDGIQNEKGMGRSSEFLGYSGTDLEAIIDLGSETEFSKVVINSFTETGSWIYPPKSASFLISDDGINFTEPGDQASDIEPYPGRKTRLRSLHQAVNKARYIKIIVKNYGIIPAGMPGAGSPAWLFIDEIEVD